GKSVMKLILSDKGRSDLKHYLPEEAFIMTSESGEINDEQIERRKRSPKILYHVMNYYKNRE
ncbi:MAG: hypothetical protein SPJ62_08330, partial [Inconstantimicrobium porci]|uniref:hypothetical protein n=1 Tax=Inconstantimicrobium porci TaxID=2652291 RepID=UPI002A9117A6